MKDKNEIERRIRFRVEFPELAEFVRNPSEESLEEAVKVIEHLDYDLLNECLHLMFNPGKYEISFIINEEERFSEDLIHRCLEITEDSFIMKECHLYISQKMIKEWNEKKSSSFPEWLVNYLKEQNYELPWRIKDLLNDPLLFVFMFILDNFYSDHHSSVCYFWCSDEMKPFVKKLLEYDDLEKLDTWNPHLKYL